LPQALDGEHINSETIQRAIERYRDYQLAEKLAGARTWKKHAYSRRRALEVADAGHTTTDGYLKAALQLYGANSAARLQLFDLLRAVWEHAGWEWPRALKPLRGNGKAVAPPEGVLAATDEVIQELRARLEQGLNRVGARKTPPSRSVEFDLLICFGLRPQELQGLVLTNEGGQLLAHVSRIKKSGRGQTKLRVVPAVPPSGAGADCWALWERWHQFGLSSGTVTNEDPGHRLTELFCRLRKQPAVFHELPEGLRLYGFRHAFALRLGIELALTVREAAELMGHSPSTHLNTYGRQLDAPRLQAKVGALVRERANEHY
jgi:integrase